MKQSEQISDLASALAKAAALFPPIERGCTAKVKTKSGAEYSYDYADLDDVLSAVRPHLAANGLTLKHDHLVIRGEPRQDGSVPLAVETTAILLHASGQWQESTPLYIPCDGTMAPAQLIGSGSTYGRRYTTQAILGLSTEQDDDGNSASGNSADTGRRASKSPCPKCGKQESVIKGKAEFGGGWVCWNKKGGCGNQWQDEPAKEPPANGEQPAQTALDSWAVWLKDTPDLKSFNAALPELAELEARDKAIIKVWLADHARSQGWTMPKGGKEYVQAAEVATV